MVIIYTKVFEQLDQKTKKIQSANVCNEVSTKNFKMYQFMIVIY